MAVQKVKNFISWVRKPKETWRETIIETVFVLIPAVFLIRTFIFGLYMVPTGSMETTLLVGERFFADKLTLWFKPIKRGEVISFNDPEFSYSANPVICLWQNYVWGPSNWTKRVIGIPGDHVVGKIEDGHPVVYINGQKLDEPYINRYPLLAVRTRGNSYRRSMVFQSFDPESPYNNQPFYNVQPADVVYPKQMRVPGTPLEEVTFFGKTCRDIFDVVLGPDQYWLMGDNRLGSHDSRFLGPVSGRLIHGRIIFCILSIDTDNTWLILDILNPIAFFNKVRWKRTFRVIH